MVLIKLGSKRFSECFWFDSHDYDFEINGNIGFDRAEECSTLSRSLTVRRKVKNA